MKDYVLSSRIVDIMMGISNKSCEDLYKVINLKDAKAFANKRLRTGFTIEEIYSIANYCGFEMIMTIKKGEIIIPISELKGEQNEEKTKM